VITLQDLIAGELFAVDDARKFTSRLMSFGKAIKLEAFPYLASHQGWFYLVPWLSNLYKAQCNLNSIALLPFV
jgi:hypothetical protein